MAQASNGQHGNYCEALHEKIECQQSLPEYVVVFFSSDVRERKALEFDLVFRKGGYGTWK